MLWCRRSLQNHFRAQREASKHAQSWTMLEKNRKVKEWALILRRNHSFDIMCLISYTTDLLLIILYLLKIVSWAANVSPKGSWLGKGFWTCISMRYFSKPSHARCVKRHQRSFGSSTRAKGKTSFTYLKTQNELFIKFVLIYNERWLTYNGRVDPSNTILLY